MVTIMISDNLQEVTNMMVRTVKTVSKSEIMVITPWVKIELIVSISFITRVVDLPIGVVSKYLNFLELM